VEFCGSFCGVFDCQPSTEKRGSQRFLSLFFDLSPAAAAGASTATGLKFRTVSAISAGNLLFLAFVGKQVHEHHQNHKDNTCTQKVIHKKPPYFSQLQPEQQPLHFPPSGQPMHFTPFRFAL
jgi:hypothetical protein